MKYLEGELIQLLCFNSNGFHFKSAYSELVERTKLFSRQIPQQRDHPLTDDDDKLLCELGSFNSSYNFQQIKETKSNPLIISFLPFQPPENELQKIHETPMLSEHQLRVQASLQKLNIPDWYRQYNDSRGELRSPSSPAPPPGGTGNQRKRGLSSSGADATGIPPSSSTGGGHAKWTGLSSKTTSLSSLGGGGGHGSQRYDKNSTMLLSPSSHSHHGGTTTTTTGYSR